MGSSSVIIGRMSTTTTSLSIFLFALIFFSIAVNAQSQSDSQQDDAYTTDFSKYPQSAQPCLQKSANTTTCTGSTHAEINACLCPGTDISSFPVRAAICVGRKSPGDLWAVFALLKADCEDSKTPLSVTRRRFMQIAIDAGTTYTGSKDNTTSGDYKSPKPTKGVELSTDNTDSVTTGNNNKSNNNNNNSSSSSNNNNAGELSMMAKMGIIISCIVIGSLLGAIITYWLLLRHKKNSNRRIPDPEKRPIFSSASSLKGGSQTPLSRASTVGSLRDWRMMDQGATRSPSVPNGSIRGVPYLGAPSPMTPQGRWVLDPLTGRYILVGVQPLPAAPSGPRMPPPSVPPTPAPEPVEAPGVDVPIEMPSTPSTVTMVNWPTPTPQTNTQSQQTTTQPYPIQTSMLPQNTQNSQSRQGSVSVAASPSSIHYPKATPQPQPTAGVPKRQYSLRNMFHTRQPNKNPGYWI
ncbi:hypothetical protein MCOR25_006304 [Pyricularia grisea]|uniref:Extracellular membrane protein CFEM domain-containing protein n=1 Tax=Pyricularia grisea TaxID=148305 RepID=A0A6P8BGE5_PYRGI|nr:uncharacterized protein PgNI_02000 [Pyricularia grisea]KAI6362069.1 hypothetical protein MCOR25_006304 [Pyricularia grisea]TLD15853.1 hypothetical protein PgNI_02000 [Pyricularia grisea]